MRRTAAFTLIEIAISVLIMLLLLGLAVPSMNGVLADRRLHRSLDAMNALVRQAQERSIREHRPYLIVWEKEAIVLRTAAPAKDEGDAAVATLPFKRGDAFRLTLPAALTDDPPAEWTFWPSGICEPAVVRYKGNDGAWTANYSPLTALPQLTQYAAR